MYVVATVYNVATKLRTASKPEHGQRLEARRAQIRKSLDDIANETDGLLYKQFLYRLENGKKKPSTLTVEQIRALANSLEWTPQQLADALEIVLPSSIRAHISDTAEGITANLRNYASQSPTSGNRLRTLREDRGLTIEQVAEQTGGVPTARRLANLEDKPGAWQRVTEDEVKNLASAYGMSVINFLDSVNGTPYPAKPNIYTDEATLINPDLRHGTRKIPKYDWVGMGSGGRDPEVIAYVDIPDTWVGEYFSCDARGDSMEPLIPDGTVLIIKAQATADINQVVLCYTPEHGTMLKVLGSVLEDGTTMLTSFNPVHPPIWTRELKIHGVLWETRTAWKSNGRHRG